MPFANKRILIFGDSLSHPGADTGPEQSNVDGPTTSSAPGAMLAGKLVAAGASAARIDARVGRSAPNFWSREDAATLLKSDIAWRPDIVIVMLGTNDLGMGVSADEKAFAKIRDVFQGAEVWAIGPPSFAATTMQAQTDAVVATMRRVFGDKFVDARPLTADLTGSGVRTGDGVHFQTRGAETFATRLLGALGGIGTGVTARAGMSTGAKVAIGGGVAVGLGLIGGLVFARKRR